MVDVTGKDEVYREATATGFIKLKPETVKRIKEGSVEKGDVLTVSTIAAINAVKSVPHLLPLTHNIPITSVDVEFTLVEDGVRVHVKVKTTAKTGVEMEALMGVLVALLNIWDMVKKYEKDERGQYPHTVISDVRVVEKIKGV
ncbi:MAG: cyclic pyranopterin monophosphate synthase MoaC [Desulfurococcaceae archaeon]|nr:cyclic pyranopterin monophosphate synthase MoaC [Desulfurococcaceae archaeon]